MSTKSAINGHLPGRRLRLAGVLYSRESADREVLGRFAATLKDRGWRVGGLVQETLPPEPGLGKAGIDAVALDTGERFPINRPTRQSVEGGNCTLDSQSLADTTAALRRAVAERVDLMVVEKFGEQEQKGAGLADEILAAMAEGVPTLVSVPAAAIEAWNTFTGGLGVLLPNEWAALWRWWGPDGLYCELAYGVSDAPARRVLIGLNWTLVEAEDGWCGVAQTPARDTPGCRAVRDAGAFAGRPLSELAALAGSWNPFEAAVGIAAVNAHHNRAAGPGGEENGLDAYAEVDGPVAVIGAFPGVRERLKRPMVVEVNPAEGDFPAVAGPQIIARAEAAIVTASTLVNRTLPGLLTPAAQARTRVALVGPGTPLCPHLFDYGIEALSGLVITDATEAARIVAEGGGGTAFKSCGRQITLRKS